MTASSGTPWATGSCLCGTVKYVLSKEPSKVDRFICHCVLCKKASGSAFMTNWWIADDGNFQVIAGEENLGQFVVTDTLSSAHVTRKFCKGCGSPINLKSTSSQVAGKIGITAGTLDFDRELPAEQNQSLNWTPNMEVFTQDRVISIPPVEGVPQISTRTRKS